MRKLISAAIAAGLKSPFEDELSVSAAQSDGYAPTLEVQDICNVLPSIAGLQSHFNIDSVLATIPDVPVQDVHTIRTLQGINLLVAATPNGLYVCCPASEDAATVTEVDITGLEDSEPHLIARTSYELLEVGGGFAWEKVAFAPVGSPNPWAMWTWAILKNRVFYYQQGLGYIAEIVGESPTKFRVDQLNPFGIIGTYDLYRWTLAVALDSRCGCTSASLDFSPFGLPATIFGLDKAHTVLTANEQMQLFLGGLMGTGGGITDLVEDYTPAEVEVQFALEDLLEEPRTVSFLEITHNSAPSELTVAFSVATQLLVLGGFREANSPLTRVKVQYTTSDQPTDIVTAYLVVTEGMDSNDIIEAITGLFEVAFGNPGEVIVNIAQAAFATIAFTATLVFADFTAQEPTLTAELVGCSPSTLCIANTNPVAYATDPGTYFVDNDPVWTGKPYSYDTTFEMPYLLAGSLTATGISLFGSDDRFNITVERIEALNETDDALFHTAYVKLDCAAGTTTLYVTPDGTLSTAPPFTLPYTQEWLALALPIGTPVALASEAAIPWAGDVTAEMEITVEMMFGSFGSTNPNGDGTYSGTQAQYAVLALGCAPGAYSGIAYGTNLTCWEADPGMEGLTYNPAVPAWEWDGNYGGCDGCGLRLDLIEPAVIPSTVAGSFIITFEVFGLPYDIQPGEMTVNINTVEFGYLSLAYHTDTEDWGNSGGTDFPPAGVYTLDFFSIYGLGGDPITITDIWIYAGQLPDGESPLVDRPISIYSISAPSCTACSITIGNGGEPEIVDTPLAAMVGITTGKSRLMAWDQENAIYRSAILDPLDFVPAIATQASIGKVAAVRGNIVMMAPYVEGFIVYSTDNVVRAEYEATDFVFKYRELPSSGIADPRHLAYSPYTHVFFNINGLHKYTPSSDAISSLSPQLDHWLIKYPWPLKLSYLGERYIVVYLPEPLYSEQQARRRREYAAVQAEYLPVSALPAMPLNSVNYHTHKRAILFDETLKQLGSCDMEHWVLFSMQPLNASGLAIDRAVQQLSGGHTLGGLLPDVGTVLFTPNSETAFVALGHLLRSPTGLTTFLESYAEFVNGPTDELAASISWELFNAENQLQRTIDFSLTPGKLAERQYSLATDRYADFIIAGAFTLKSFVVATTRAGEI